MQPGLPVISGVMVSRDRVASVRRALDSISAQTLESFELLVVLNGATAPLESLVRDASVRDPRIRAIRIEETSASIARNVASREARAPLVYFLDDDVELPPHLFSLALEHMTRDPAIGILGGPNLTAPSEGFFARLSGALLASPVGTGITRARYAPSRADGPATEADLILCNLVVRRALLGEVRFPGLFGGEENVLMGHAVATGAKMAYVSALWVHHKRRDTLRGYVEQIFRYGAGRANALVFAPNTFRVAYFVPVALLVYTLGWPMLACLTPLAHVPMLAYAALTLIASLVAAVETRTPSFFVPLLALFPLTHLTYAAGLLSRLITLRSVGRGAPEHERAPGERS